MSPAPSSAPCGARHVVAVYDDDDELVSAGAAFLDEALVQGGAAAVIANAAHRPALDCALAARGHSLHALIASGRYRSFDAAATLAEFMSGDRPDPAEFASAVGSVLDDLAPPGGPIRLFGEMVGLLWADGNLGAAIELETLWNDLGEQHAFELFCAYPMSSLETSTDLSAVKRMCEQHSTILALQAGSSPQSVRTAVAGREHYDRLFVATPSVLRGMRHFVREALDAWGDDELATTAEIVASELASNAVRHARSPFCVSISRSPDAIRIEVRDASFELPEYVRTSAAQTGGRGVCLIAALSRAWGIRDELDGKTVWAELAHTSTN